MYHRAAHRIPRSPLTLSSVHFVDRGHLCASPLRLGCATLLPRSLLRPAALSRHHASLAKSVPDTIGQQPASGRHPHDSLAAEQKPDQALAKAEEAVDTRTQRQKDYAIVKQLMPNIWPKGDNSTKTRVVLAVSLLVAGKVRLFQ